MYRKLKRVWSNGYANYIPNFDKVFPELKHLTSDELYNRFKKLKLDFYTEEQTPVKPWNRIGMPFAILLMLLMFIGIPFVFIITGEWSYPLGEKNRILNWFRSLHLF